MKKAAWVFAVLIFTLFCVFASADTLVLPSDLQKIESKAFSGINAEYVIFPSGITEIADDAFEGASFVGTGDAGGYAQEWCVNHGFRFESPGVKKVGIAMPTKDLYRWMQDGENLREKLEAAGFEAELQYASNDVPTQESQIEAMIDHGCEAIVIAAIDNFSLDTVLSRAKEQGISIIAYDRLIMESEAVDYYVTFDSYAVGALQGRYIRDALDLDNAQGPFSIEFTAGDPGDDNASVFFSGAMDVLRPYLEAGKLTARSGGTDFQEVSTQWWSPDNAQRRAESILTSFYAGSSVPDAWMCSNDSTATGVIRALEAGNKDKWPIITGQDCDIYNVRSIISGKQSMSVFKDTRILADRTVKMVMQILNGEAAEVNDTETFNNYRKNVPTFLCEPIVVDRSNYRILIEAGYYSEDILTD